METPKGQSDLGVFQKSNPPLMLQETLGTFMNQPGSGTLLLLGEADLCKMLTTYFQAQNASGHFGFLIHEHTRTSLI